MMTLPGECFVGAGFTVNGPFGWTVATLRGVRVDSNGTARLVFDGWDAEEGEDWTWEPPADVIREVRVTSWPRDLARRVFPR